MNKITVVIPLYNKEKYICRAVSSVLEQTVREIELIIVDDGSKDNSLKMLEKFDDRRIKIIKRANGGECAARNTGIAAAKTELISFLDADDAYKPQFLETVLRLREQYPDAGAYVTAYEFKEPNGSVIKPKYKSISLFPWEGIIPNYFQSALGPPPICSSAVAVPKSVFQKVGIFQEGKKSGGDLDMWLRIAIRYKIAFSTHISSTYHRDAAGRVCDTISLDKINESIDLVNSNKALLDDIPKEKEYLYAYEYINKLLLWIVPKLILLGELKQARNLLYSINTRRFILTKIFYLMLTFLPAGVVKSAIFCKRNIVSFRHKS